MAEILLNPKVLNLFGVLLLMLTLAMLGLRGFKGSLNAYALHSLLIAIITLIFGLRIGNEHIFIAAGATFLIKVLIIPALMIRLVNTMRIRLEHKLLVSPPVMSVAAVGLVVMASHIASVLIGINNLLGTISTASIAAAMLGMLMMVSRKDAVIQVIGLLSMENGFFLVGLIFTGGMPFFVEIGILFDVVLTSILLWVYLKRMDSQFKSTNTMNLNQLRG
jgi:hydrogenase-4 component E